jgi:hypothetical protein
MLVFPHPFGVPPPAEITTATAALVARQRPVLIHEARLVAQRVAEAFESALVE